MSDVHARPLALDDGSPGYQLFMLILCSAALVILVLEAAFRLDPKVSVILDYADTILCVLFLIDFALSFARARGKWNYLITWGWLDLLSSIPVLDVVRWGRIARVARLFRVLRTLRAVRLLTTYLFRKRTQSAAFAAMLIALFLVVGSSVAVLRFEDLPESNIRTADDALWWAFATITTVGYGDRFPVSGEGRLIAAILMTAGMGLFGAFSATLAAWFLAPEEEATDEEIASLRAEIMALRQLVEERLPKP